MASKELKPFRPMLAIAPKTEEEWARVSFPSYLSPKYDGVRATALHGQLQARSNMPFGNRSIDDYFKAEDIMNFDGEMIVGDPNHKDVFRKTQSAISEVFGTPKFQFYVFDYIDPVLKFSERLAKLRLIFGVSRGPSPKVPNCILVPQMLVHSAEEAIEITSKLIANGYEGGMLKKTDGLYKFGRSTLRSGECNKIKGFVDADAIIIGMEEMETNTNALGISALGYAKRSSAKAGMVKAGTMGKLLCRDPTGQWKDFAIGGGPGLTAQLRQWYWGNREALIAMQAVVEFKYQPVGSFERPRLPGLLRMKTYVRF